MIIWFFKQLKVYLKSNFKIIKIIKITVNNLLFQRTYSEDEAEQRYETIIVLSLRGLNLFMSYYFSSSSKLFKDIVKNSNEASTNNLSISEKLVKIFATESKFWRFAKENSLKVI